ncbi:MAG TPA: DUF3108 domain-containing protein [Xanthobacteraceae bacterium]|nr:DUF3108 domain-containing protein [Xanthobacteraceae bacterium]
MLPLLRRLPRLLPSRAPVAAACLVAALVADGGHTAGAQGRLDAEYVATVSGIPVGHGSWTVEISDKAYSAAATGATAGLLKIFSGARGSGTSHGTISGAGPVPTSYVATIVDDRHVDEVRIALAGGNVTEFSAEPPLTPLPERIPVTDADRHNVVDPMTSALSRVGGNGDPISPAACQRKVAVFDGRVRYDLHSKFKRIETVKAERGYQGPAVVCALYFQPISGYVPDRAAVRYLVELHDAEVWLAPIAGTRVLVPFRVAMPTPLGQGILQAKQFVTIAQPTRAAAKTQ